MLRDLGAHTYIHTYIHTYYSAFVHTHVHVYLQADMHAGNLLQIIPGPTQPYHEQLYKSSLIIQVA